MPDRHTDSGTDLDRSAPSSPADLVVAGARCVATVDGDRREIDGGWVAR